jgi:hypothetical protein
MTMKKKLAFWKKERPASAGKPDKLTPQEKQKAKARAKAAGRPYPNLIDNAAVSRGGK